MMPQSHFFEPNANRPVVGRFAPSPTGRMHAGNIYAALSAWLVAKSQGGTIVLRIEDLDRDRSKAEYISGVQRDFELLGLTWDHGPFFQHDRDEVYLEAFSALERKGLVYPCFCTRSELHAATAPHASDGTYVYAGTCRGLSADEVAARAAVRPPATRLRVPEADDPAGVVGFCDLAYGAQREVLAHECGDFLVRRSDGVVAYQLAVVVDDAEMGVTQVVRGRDLLGSAPRQMYLQSLLGYGNPEYGHVPLLVAPDGRRLSKRERDLDLGALRERFGTPAPLIGAIASRLGLAEAGETLTADALVSRFSWETVANHREDIVVGEDFLSFVGGNPCSLAGVRYDSLAPFTES